MGPPAVGSTPWGVSESWSHDVVALGTSALGVVSAPACRSPDQHQLPHQSNHRIPTIPAGGPVSVVGLLRYREESLVMCGSDF